MDIHLKGRDHELEVYNGQVWHIYLGKPQHNPDIARIYPGNYAELTKYPYGKGKPL